MHQHITRGVAAVVDSATITSTGQSVWVRDPSETADAIRQAEKLGDDDTTLIPMAHAGKSVGLYVK